MLFVDLELKVLAQRHGHLCPYLALGWRVGVYFRELLPRPFPEDFTVLAYNRSCAVSALRLMGFRVRVEDLNEHTYSLLDLRGDPLSFVTVQQDLLLPSEALWELGQKLRDGQATYYEKAHYTYLIDSWVADILSASEEALFGLEDIQVI